MTNHNHDCEGELTIIYIVRDRATQGVDFLLWGTDIEAARTTFAECRAEGLDVEMVAMYADKMDAHTRHLIGVSKWGEHEFGEPGREP